MELEELKTRLSCNLKKFRKEKKWSQFDLAVQSNLAEQTINSIEGKRIWASDKTLVKLANALEIDVFYLLLPSGTEKSGKSIFPEKLRASVVNSVRELVEGTLREFEV